MSSKKIIQDWVDSISQSITPGQGCEPSAKRRRLDTIVQSNMPSTPPSSTNRSIPQIGRKRHSDELAGDEGGPDPDATPKPPSLPQLRTRSESPTKRTKTGLRSRGNLSRLEKPVSIVGLGTGALATKTTPEDIRGLYKDIRTAAQFKHRIVPYEVRDQILALEDDVPDAVFREPAVEVACNALPGAEVALPANALLTHITLLRIVRAATKSEQYKRSEAAWNNHVHAPLLELVFGSDPWDPEGPDADQPVVARFEAVMGATIVGTAIPFIRPSQLDQPDLACSVSLDSSAEGTNMDIGRGIDITKLNLTDLHSRSESKKVDYVLVMYINENEKLRQIIWDSSFEKQLGHGYINQTLLLNLLYNPIAVSIETKITSSQADPLVQLGLWTAAWHKRMYELRDRLFPLTPQAYLPSGSTRTHPKLVSVPVIEVISHEWFIYFACDLGQSIRIYGPLRLGSTNTLLEIYTLVASLGYIKKWIETTFRKGIEAWFMQA
ncbi:putative methyltransferase type 11 [Rosellinia necatrix]|uniref:Putative methyltransferase type 11 n=1 Tax=Rosellinia necatrix TaxID=77044 RepID=A0A1W2TXH4_ROSNE|nr:putative methyltransferase type 11 [Rosellinia necatrix]